jgi:uncharacterized ferritin-like protein (DUF455 family)
MTSLTEAAVEALAASDPKDKIRLTLQSARQWHDGVITEIGAAKPPARPGRPAKPLIMPPNKMPRRGTAGMAGRIAMFHALAHIEFNAIDLAWDIIARFAAPTLPKGFYDDWVLVAKQEAEHFVALDMLLRQMGAEYGSLPAHDGLWQAAEKTSKDLLKRLAVVPMTFEARALDTAPVTINKLTGNVEQDTLFALRKIVDEEVIHVAAGTRWFNYVCDQQGIEPRLHYQSIIRDFFPDGLKPPFNKTARDKAGLPADYYEPLAAG